MRRFWLLLPLAVLLSCANPPSPKPMESGPVAISCQPYGYNPAPIAFSFRAGPVTGAEAEETAVALFRACELPTITNLTSSSRAGTGRGSPNDGQAVWWVEVGATIAVPSSEGYQAHWLVEVNQATGFPTLIAYG